MTSPRVIIYGGKGALGSVCVKYFKEKGFWVGSIDLRANDEAQHNVIVTKLTDLNEQADEISSAIGNALDGNKVDGIICVAGGWAGGNAKNDAFIKNTNMMCQQSIWSSVISANLAAHFLKEGGLLTLTGAIPALEGTPGMIGYGMAKAAVHQLTKSLGAKDGGLPDGAKVVAILPQTLSTPMNKKWMADADQTAWTPLEFVADLFHIWMTEESNCPKSGSLVKLETKDDKTACTCVEE